MSRDGHICNLCVCYYCLHVIRTWLWLALVALAVAAEDEDEADGDLDEAPSRSARLSVDAEPPDELPVFGMGFVGR